jgi:hypothetical protein
MVYVNIAVVIREECSIIGDLLAKVSTTLSALSANSASGPGDPAAEILEGPRATSPAAAEDDQGERAGELA